MPKVLYRFFEAGSLNETFTKAFLTKTTTARIQFFRYIFVGGFSALVNLGCLYVLTSLLNVHYLVSELVAFIIATVVNYVLSVWWIFERSSQFKLEFLLFTLVGVGGLGINEAVLWLSVTKLHFFYLLGEALAIAVVTVWSFTLRRVLFVRLAPANPNDLLS